MKPATIDDRRRQRRGETGLSAHARIDSHEKQRNSLAQHQHLQHNHLAQRRDVDAFCFKVVTPFSKWHPETFGRMDLDLDLSLTILIPIHATL